MRFTVIENFYEAHNRKRRLKKLYKAYTNAIAAEKSSTIAYHMSPRSSDRKRLSMGLAQSKKMDYLKALRKRSGKPSIERPSPDKEKRFAIKSKNSGNPEPMRALNFKLRVSSLKRRKLP